MNIAAKNAVDYADNGNLKTETDLAATEAKIDGRIDLQEYREWLEQLFAGVVEKKGIRNDRDMFTPSGSSRKWESLYDAVTLDNVVSAMQRQALKGGEGPFGSSIFGASTKELKDIGDIRREAAARIASMPEEEHEAEVARINERLVKVSLPSASQSISASMDFVENVKDAVTRTHTAAEIYRYLKGIYPDMIMEAADEIADIVGDIQKMATRYLEAKPQRAVGFEEVKLAVVPDGTASEVVGQLERLGIPVRTYERGNQHQRSTIISHETAEQGLRFHVAMARDREDFDAMLERAVRERGIVMPGLNEATVRVIDVAPHDFTGEKPIAQARQWAKSHIVGEHTLVDSDGVEQPYIISGRAVDKYLSSSAIDKSANSGAHLSVLTRLPEVIDASIEAEVHPDFKKKIGGIRLVENGYNKDLLIHRLYGAVNIVGETYRVKTTIKESRIPSEELTAHSFEVTEIELLSEDNSPMDLEPTASDYQGQLPHGTANLLQGVEKSYEPGKKILDESENAGMVREENSHFADRMGRPHKVMGSGNRQLSLFEAMEDEDAQANLFTYSDGTTEEDEAAGAVNAEIDNYMEAFGAFLGDYAAVEEDADLTDKQRTARFEELEDAIFDRRDAVINLVAAYYSERGVAAADARLQARDFVSNVQAQVSAELGGKAMLRAAVENQRAATTAPAAATPSYSTLGGDVITYSHAGALGELGDGEFCLVERRFAEDRQFAFSGSAKVESADDVAYIFRQLENSAVENTFVAFVKDGKPYVVHVGIGSAVASMVDGIAVRGAWDALGGADAVYFVHNHSSGNLRASSQDHALLKAVEGMFPGVKVGGVIIDTRSGKYGTFGQLLGDGTTLRPASARGGETPVTVSQFSGYEFSADFNPDNLTQIGNSGDIAKFVSTQRLGARGKVGALILSQQNGIVANFHLPFADISDAEAVAETIAACARAMAARVPCSTATTPTAAPSSGRCRQQCAARPMAPSPSSTA